MSVYEEHLGRVAVRVLCGPRGCAEDGDCPFDPMCAADLTAESAADLIVKRVTELEAALARVVTHCDDLIADCCGPDESTWTFCESFGCATIRDIAALARCDAGAAS